MGSCESPENAVQVNGCVIQTSSPLQSIFIFVAAYLAFNLCHSRRQERTLEALEGILQISKDVSLARPRNLLKSLAII